jgi:hypothetical protein
MSRRRVIVWLANQATARLRKAVTVSTFSSAPASSSSRAEPGLERRRDRALVAPVPVGASLCRDHEIARILQSAGLARAVDELLDPVSSDTAGAAHSSRPYAPDVSPVVALLAEEGARAMVAALLAVRSAPDGLAARTEALYAAWLCGSVVGATTMSLHHKLCHVLGGTLDLPVRPPTLLCSRTCWPST